MRNVDDQRDAALGQYLMATAEAKYRKGGDWDIVDVGKAFEAGYREGHSTCARNATAPLWNYSVNPKT